MARIDEKDLWKYHKLENDFMKHYLKSYFNDLLDFIENQKGTKDIILHNMMSAVESTVAQIDALEKERNQLNNYIAYLQEELKKLINKK